jgi:two-component system sensor histidine kinase NreB
MKIRQAFSSLHVRVALVILLAVAPSFVAMLVTAAEWRRHETTDARADALRLARCAAGIHERLVGRSEQILVAASRGGHVASAGSAIPSVFAAFSDLRPAVGLMGPDEKVEWLTPVESRQGSSAADPAVLRRARESGEFAVGDYAFDRLTGHGSITVAHSPGRSGHVVFAVFDAGWLNELAREAGFPEGTTVSILDERGATVVPDPSLRQAGWRADVSLATAIAGGQPKTLDGAVRDGVARFFAVTPLRTGSRQFYVAVGIPQSAATAGVETATTSVVTGLGLALLLALVVAPIGIRWSVAGPLKSLSEAAGRVSRGELGTRTALSDAPAELAQLAGAFDDMAANLEKRDREVAMQTTLLTALERRFRALTENAADGIVLMDRQGLIRYASPSTTRILGYTVKELVGRSVFEPTHEEDLSSQLAGFNDLLRVPGSVTSARLRLQHKDGSWRWLESVATNLLEDPAVRAVVVNYRDITSRLEAEERLRQAHDELERRVETRTAELVKANDALQTQIAERAVIERHLLQLWHAFEQTTDCMFVTNDRGVIEYVNPAFERVTGYSMKEAVGSNPKMVHSGQHDKPFYERLWRTILSGSVFRSVFVNRSKDGRIYYEDRTITPVRDEDGKVTHFVSTGRDITKTRRSEQALRRMNARLEEEATRIAGVLHDEAGQFLTSAHITLSEVARDLPQEARERLQDVRRNLDEVEEQLRRLAHEVRPRVLDDLGLVEALEFLAEGVAKRTGLDISVETSVDARCCPLAETAIYRLVQEGLTNISRHAHANHVSIALALDAQTVVCTVQDDGVGFDVPAVAARRDRGLGLQGIQDRLEAVNGLLEVTSAPGEGTTLRATIPLEN